MFKKFILYSALFSLLAGIAAAGTLYWFVAIDPGKEVELEHIKKILGKESNVYYSDGSTRLGVFFNQTHRQYVHYSEIPKDFVNALTAAEDDRSFSHFAFDLLGITRAMIKNVQAGRIVQGGSTLTQQTAKNLFKRKDRSISEKLKELLFALRLEHRYSKEQIFEFYANQFYVSGNGHGLGVAAQYYFNKKASQLNLVESAFIAGSVKRPNYYNPFTKKSDAAVNRAQDHANTRLAYVLGKMKKLGMITDQEYAAGKAEDVPFKRGQFGYELDYTMEMVRDAVEREEIRSALAEHGIDNISTSGISIITSINKDIQATTVAALRQQLSDLDVRLRGYEGKKIQKELTTLKYQGDSKLKKNAFIFATITAINHNKDGVSIDIDLDHRLGQGTISQKGLQTIINNLAQWRKNRWAKVTSADRKALLKELNTGDRIWVRVLDISDDKTAICQLVKYPKIQGGALVSQDGALKSVAGGSENRFYNRAIYGKRSMGSIFKPFLFTAAMQMGWNSADALDNRRNLFIFHGQPYFPRPDHISPYPFVSMSWTGIKSENLASIWLLYHLTDHLSQEQFYDIAKHLDLAPRKLGNQQESYSSYSRRIRDKYGIIINRSTLQELAYLQAVKNSETDFLFENMEFEFKNIRNLPYGSNFEKFRQELAQKKELDIQEKSKDNRELSEREQKEYKLREKLLSRSFLDAKVLLADLQLYRQQLAASYDFFGFTEAARPNYSRKEDTPYLYYSAKNDRYYFGYGLSEESDLRPLALATVRQQLRGMSSLEEQAFWSNVFVDNMLTPRAYAMINKQAKYEYEALGQSAPYTFNVLAKSNDFRITVALQYLVNLAREMGVSSQLDPVLSFPLGSNAITLLESVSIYETMVTGKRWFTPVEDEAPFRIIERIEDPDGEILYQSKPQPTTLVDDKIRIATADILHNVTKLGTGRSASRSVHFSSADPSIEHELRRLKLPVPLMGKTGTANNYTNAAFLGYLPGDNDGKLSLEHGYTIGAYVGFDQNMPMKYKNIRIAGSSGALPIWNHIANKILLEKKYATGFNLVDASFDGIPLHYPDIGQNELAMDTQNGGLLSQPPRNSKTGATITTFASLTGNKVQLKREYKPFWLNKKGKE